MKWLLNDYKKCSYLRLNVRQFGRMYLDVLQWQLLDPQRTCPTTTSSETTCTGSESRDKTALSTSLNSGPVWKKNIVIIDHTYVCYKRLG